MLLTNLGFIRIYIMPESSIISSLSEEVTNAYKCPLTKKFMVEPVMLTSDGHTYEKEEIEKEKDAVS